MKPRFCYWSVVDGPYVDMMQAVVLSARRVGVFHDFHIWSDRPINDARSHPVRQVQKAHYLFKLHFLRERVSRLPYDYFVWLDADTWFTRHPGDVLSVLQGAPVHSSLEADACDPANVRPDWWGCPLPDYAKLMRFKGVHQRSIYNVNAGFWIVHRDVIPTFFDLAFDFWQVAQKLGYADVTEEPPLAYATQMLCGNPHLHTLRHTSDLWASDWLGCYADSVPDGRPWMFEDYFNGQRWLVNPAIVHAMRSKKALLKLGRSRRTTGCNGSKAR